jgi:hypothetical protein
MAEAAAEKAPQSAPSSNGAAADQPGAWEWTEKGVRIGEKEFAFAKTEPGQIQEYAGRLLEVTEAFRSMLRLRAVFESGRLESFEGAWEKSRQVFREVQKAELALAETTSGISIFFEPADIAREFDGESKLLKGFIEEAIDRIGGR